jgi:hypothetical protein
MITRDASSHQFFGYPLFGAVMLDPHLAVTNIHVQDRAMDTMVAIPVCVTEFIMIASFVKDGLNPNFTIRGLETCLIANDILGM